MVDHYPIIVKLLSAFYLFSPNFLYLLDFFKDHVYLIMILNYWVVFLSISYLYNKTDVFQPKTP